MRSALLQQVLIGIIFLNGDFSFASETKRDSVHSLPSGSAPQFSIACSNGGTEGHFTYINNTLEIRGHFGTREAGRFMFAGTIVGYAFKSIPRGEEGLHFYGESKSGQIKLHEFWVENTQYDMRERFAFSRRVEVLEMIDLYIGTFMAAISFCGEVEGLERFDLVRGDKSNNPKHRRMFPVCLNLLQSP